MDARAHASQVTPREVAGQWDPLIGAEVRQAEAEVGAEQLAVFGQAGIAGDAFGGFVDLDAEHCYGFLSRGTSTATDLDIWLFGDDGHLVASDERLGPAAAVVTCPDSDQRVYASTRFAGGYGLAALAVVRVLAPAGEGLASRWHAPSTLTPSPGASLSVVEQHVRERLQWEGSLVQNLDLKALPLEPAVSAELPLALGAGKCLGVWVGAEDSINGLELELKDDWGRWLSGGYGTTRERWLTVCGAQAHALVLGMRPHSGQGFARIAVAEMDGARELPGGREPVLELDTSTLERETIPLGASVLKTSRGMLKATGRITVPFDLPAGCQRILVAPEAPVFGVRGQLWQGDERLAGSDTPSARGRWFRCGAKGITAELELESLSREGAFSLQVIETPGLPAWALQQGDTAGRLAELLERRGWAFADAGRTLTREDLSPQQRRKRSVPLEGADCIEVAAAVDAAAAGLRVTLSATPQAGSPAPGRSAHSSMDVGYGRHAAAARLCPAPETEEVQLELSVAQGQSGVLWTMRRFAADSS